MRNTDKPIHLRAFVGRSFLETDKRVWHDLRDLLEALSSLGFTYEDAKEAQVRPISEKVRELIDGNDIYIGLLTRRHAVHATPSTFLKRLCGLFQAPIPDGWAASEWVIEEIGYAIGKGKPVILLIEQNVIFPTADLDADTQWIRFSRERLESSQTELTQMVAGLVAKRVTGIPSTAIASATEEPRPEEPSASKEPQGTTFGTKLEALRNAASNGNQTEAARIHQEILRDDTDVTDGAGKVLLDIFLLSERAKSGDGSALDELKNRSTNNPGDFDVTRAIYDAYVSFGEFDAAIKLLEKNALQIAPNFQVTIAILIAAALRKNGAPEKALELLAQHLSNEIEELNQQRLFRAMSYAAQDQKNKELESACLERFLELNPSDNDIRFRLAYLYGENDRDALAAHHYGILARRVDWPNVTNNLGVAYGKLDLKASQIDQFLKVMDKHGLAKANVANLYVEAGFLSDAEKLAGQVLGAADQDENALSRARYASGEVSSIREKETSKIAEIASETREERDFMSEYAKAYVAPSSHDFEATFKTSHGDIQISRKGGTLQGSGIFTRTSGGLIALAMTRGMLSSPPPPRTYELKLSGTCHGRSASYELRISTKDDPGTLLTPTHRQISGLLILNESSNSYRALEREDKKTRFSSAERI